MDDWQEHESTMYGIFGLFAGLFTTFSLLVIIKCCLVHRRTTRGTRRQRPRNAHTMVSSAAEPGQTRLLQQDLQIENRSGNDVFVFVSQPNEASPVVVPPYPVEPRHPTPHAVPPGPGFATHNPPYPTHTPHPVPAPMYYPPPVGTVSYPPSTSYPPAGSTPYPPVSGAAPYPPTGPPVGSIAPYPDPGALPPSYSEAVSQPPVQPPPAKEGYSKQAPYNPNY